jgi:hypothetical protein
VGTLSFLTPFAALVALAGVLPLVAFLRRERRARRVRATLGLAQPAAGTGRGLLVALLAVPALTGLAAAQPVLDRSRPQPERTDAEIFFVVDATRSMLAADGPEGRTRLDRARSAARAIRSSFPQIRAGIASLTDRTLPHLFPTTDVVAFRSTLSRSIGIERPPPAGFATVVTDLGALAAVGRQSYFSPTARRRLLVVLTDGETRRVAPALGVALRRARIDIVFVHVWQTGESIYVTSAAEQEYRPDPSSGRTLAALAGIVGGVVFPESDVRGAVAYARARLSIGPTRVRSQRDLHALMPYATLAAVLPLAFILLRRNL